MRIPLICISTVVHIFTLLLAASGSPLEVINDVPLGASDGSSFCSAIAIGNNGHIYLAGHSLGSATSAIWLSVFNRDGIAVSIKYIDLPIQDLDLNHFQSVIKDMYIYEGNILLFLEWKEAGKLLGKRKLAIALLNTSGDIVRFTPLPFAVESARLILGNTGEGWVIGRSLEGFWTTTCFNLADITAFTQSKLSIHDARNYVLNDLIQLNDNRFCVLMGDQLRGKLKLALISLSNGNAIEMDNIAGRDGSMTSTSNELIVLTYGALPNSSELSHSLRDEGRVRVYSISSGKQLFDTALGNASDSETPCELKAFGIEANHLVGNALHADGVSCGSTVLCNQWISSIKRQYRDNTRQYLLLDELVIDRNAPKQLRAKQQARLIIVQTVE